MTDENTLAAQAVRDPKCFTQLYSIWFGRVFNYILYRSPEPDDVEDLVMLVFEKVMKNIHRFDPEKGPFGAWLFAIARNVLNDYHRSRKFSWLPLASIRETADPIRGLEESYTRTEAQKRLLEALSKLNDRERDILGLKFAARLNNRQIAAEVGLKESHVGVIIYRSLNKLRIFLKGDIGFTGDEMGEG
jgi:RNA polymerase sigma factor (sigma-70 family)